MEVNENGRYILYAFNHILLFLISSLNSKNGSSKKISPKTFFIIVIVGFIFIALNTFVKKEYKNEPEQIPIEKNNWKTESVGETPLTIETPFIMENFNYNPPSEWDTQFSDYKFYNIGKSSIKGTIVYCTYIKSNPKVSRYLDEMAEGAIKNLQNLEGISDIKYEFATSSIADLKAKEINASFLIDNKAINQKSVFFSNGKFIWIYTFNYENEKNDIEIIDRIIKSSKVKIISR